MQGSDLPSFVVTTKWLLNPTSQILDLPQLNEQGVVGALIAGAMHFCTQHPDHFACQRIHEPTPITMNHDSERTLSDMARDYHFGGGALRRQASETNLPTGENRENESNHVDNWSPNKDGDCEDRMLHQWQTLRRDHPDIAAASRPVMFRDQPDRHGRTPGQAHIALEVHTDGGVRILDTMHSELRRMEDYRHQRAYYPETDQGVGGRWVHRDEVGPAMVNNHNNTSSTPPADTRTSTAG